MSHQLRRRYDIIINGGGIVGFSLLKLIANSPYLNRCKVLLIEQASKPANLKQPSRHSIGIPDNSNSGEGKKRGNEKSFLNRVSSITLGSKRAFKGLEVWASVEQYTKDVRCIKVWNYDYSHRMVFHQNKSLKDDRDIMFSVIENNRLSLALLDSIQSQLGKAGEDPIAWNYTLQSLGESSEHGLVDVIATNSESGEEIVANAPLVLGCDGYKSKVRDASGLKYSEYNLSKTAVVGTVKMTISGQPSENDIAYQRFSSENDTVAALLPLDREYSSFVISTSHDYAKHLMDCGDESFTQEFNRLLTSKELPDNAILKGLHDISNLVYDNLHGLLATVSSSICKTGTVKDSGNELEEPPRLDSVVSGSRASFPLIFGTTTPKMIASLPGKQFAQLALLGDSSHRVHPLAGQGLNLGIQDALELVKQLEKVAKCGEKVFNQTDLTSLNKALKKYECNRQAYILPMSASILTMPHLFKLIPSRLLSIVNKCDSIKSNSVRFANGC